MSKRKRNSKSKAGSKDKKARENSRREDPIPVTILSGFLGSGKTSLLKHILTSKEHKLKIAVIVNDMAELNVDGQIIQRTATSTGGGQSNIVKTKTEVVQLENGCICCTLRGDLIREINNIKESNQFDYVLIESTGIAEPQQVAESFCVDPETLALAGDDTRMLWNAARLDTCVTVVDCANFSNYLSSLKRFKQIFDDGLEDAEEGEGGKSISELIVEQCEFANVVLLNKVDLVSNKKLETVKALIRSLNPKAQLLTGSYGKIDLTKILNTHLFNMEEAKESPGWLLSLKDGVNASQGEADEYGVSSFVYRSRKPFHPLRLHTFLQQFFCYAEDWNTSQAAVEKASSAADRKQLEERYGKILRSKGMVWIAGRDDHEIGWAQAGQIIQLSPVAPWRCKVDPKDWEGVESDKDRAQIEALFEGTDDQGKTFKHGYGDRRQEVVFIGTNLQRANLEEEMNKCLLTEQEMENHSSNLPIGAYPDPLQPLLVSCDGDHSLFMILRPGQDQHIRILSGFSLSLHNLALNFTGSDKVEDSIKSVKVWLDKSDSVRMGVLLATLSPGKVEQHSINLPLLSCDEEGGEEVANRRLRIEVVFRNGTQKPSTPVELLNICEVHVMGKCEPVPYGSLDDEDGVDDEELDDCDTGMCEN